MKMMYRATLMVAALVFLLPFSALSEIRGGSVEVGAFGGYNYFESGQNLKNQFTYGARLGYNFTKYFGIEGTGAFINSHVDDKARTDFHEGRFLSPKDSVDLTFYHLDLIYHFIPEGKFNPFVVAGFGGAHYSPSVSNKDMAAFNVGIGAKYWLTDNIALRVDLQDYIVSEVMQSTYHNIGIMIGITYAFGGSEKPTSAQIPVAKYERISEPLPPSPKPRVEEKVVIMAAEPKIEEKVMAAAAEPKVIILAFEDVHFDFDQSTLKPEAQAILKRNVQMLKENPKTKIRVAGYTSAAGTQEYNQKLSERRAKAVQEYLINEGVITRDRLSAIGYGETHPAMVEAAPKEIYSEAAKANMRVLFEIVVQPEPVNTKDRSDTVTPNPGYRALLDRNAAANPEDRSDMVTPNLGSRAIPDRNLDVKREDRPSMVASPDVPEIKAERRDSSVAVKMSKPEREPKYTIQIKAFPGKEKTEAMAFVGAIKNEQPDVQMETVNIRKRGIWHRILLGSFSSHEEASEYMRDTKILDTYPGSFIKMQSGRSSS